MSREASEISPIQRTFHPESLPCCTRGGTSAALLMFLLLVWAVVLWPSDASSAWFLMNPPYKSAFNPEPDKAAPLRRWDIWRMYSTRKECDSGSALGRALASYADSAGESSPGGHPECVSTSDSRWKSYRVSWLLLEKQGPESDESEGAGGQFKDRKISGAFEDQEGCANAVQRKRVEAREQGSETETECVSLADPRWQNLPRATKWYLLEPPDFGGVSAPLSEWSSGGEFVTADECESKSGRLPGSKCVSSDDPRLK